MNVNELAAALGGTVCILSDCKAVAVSITAQKDGGWFWVAYDRTANRVLGCGRVATVEAAAEHAKAAMSTTAKEQNYSASAGAAA